MLQDLRSRDTSFLIDMTYDKDGQTFLLTHAHDTHGAFAYLGNAAGSGIVICVADRLDGIDDHDIGLEGIRRRKNGSEIRLCQDIDLSSQHAKTIGPKLELTLTFLTAYIEDSL